MQAVAPHTSDTKQVVEYYLSMSLSGRDNVRYAATVKHELAVQGMRWWTVGPDNWNQKTNFIFPAVVCSEVK